MKFPFFRRKALPDPLPEPKRIVRAVATEATARVMGIANGTIIVPGRADAIEAGVKRVQREFEARQQEGKGWQYIERISRLPIHEFVDYNSYLEAGSHRVWACFRACHLVASVISSTDFKVVAKGGKRVVEGQPVNAILAKPNPWNTWEQMLYQLVFHLKLTGNGYWLKDQMNGRGQPLSVWPLLPQYVQPIPDRERMVAGYRYKVNGTVIELDANEVIHFRRPHPNDNVMGMGDVRPSEDLINRYINRATYDERFMANGASPSGILTKEEATENQDEWNRFVSKWKADYQGKRNIGRTAFLNGKWNYQQLGLNAQQMQSIETDKLTIAQIFMTMGVPLSIAGVENAASYATASIDQTNFRRMECKPLLDIIVSQLNSVPDARDPLSEAGLVPSNGDGYQLDYELKGLVNVAQEAEAYGDALKQGAITLNEYREKALGLEKKDDPYLDQHFIPSNYVPLEMAGMAQAPDPVPANPVPAGGGKPPPKKPPKNPNANLGDEGTLPGANPNE